MIEGICSLLSFGLTLQYVAHAATARTSSSVRPRTLFRHVRRFKAFIPADAQTNDKSALFFEKILFGVAFGAQRLRKPVLNGPGYHPAP